MIRKTLTLACIALLLAVFSSTQLSAQTANPPREVGLQFSSLNFDGGSGFSAFFKKQKKENVYRRIRFFTGNLLFGSIDKDFTFNLSAGIAIGREKRKALDSKLMFYSGPEFSIQAGLYTFTEDDVHVVLSPAFGWVLGLQHSFNDRWAVNLETIPGVGINIDSYGDGGPGVFTFGANFNNAVSLGLVRKF